MTRKDKVASGESGEQIRVVVKLRVGWLGPDQGWGEKARKRERREKTGCLGGPDGRNETQIAIIYFRRPVITESESLRVTQFLLGSKPHAAEVNIRNVKKGLTDVKEVHKKKGFHFVVACLWLEVMEELYAHAPFLHHKFVHNMKTNKLTKLVQKNLTSFSQPKSSPKFKRKLLFFMAIGLRFL